jgi:CheY-like chemotaxis protein
VKTQPVVLYVEDDARSRKLMAMLLKGRMKLPHVTILEDSQDFLDHVDALDPKPDLILLDIHMKPHNGFEMLEMLRQLEWVNGIPIVALTASVMNEEVQQLRSAGFNGCLAKPIDLDSFPETLERILDGESIWRIFG